VVEPSRGLHFTLKALQPQVCREMWVQDLDRHRPAVLYVVRQVHRCHAAAPYLALQVVAVPQGILKAS
jgi:hypothetical protein